MNNLTTLYIVRHGQSQANLDRVVGGHYDTPLTKTGEDEARNIADELKNVKFDKIFSSDLIRAKKTAEIIALEKKLAVETTEILREQHYGKREGTSQKELFKLFDSWLNLDHQDRLKKKVDEYAESDEETISRFITFLREVSIAYKGQLLLIVCHAGLMHSFLIHLGIASYKTMKYMENTALIKVESDGIEFKILDMKGVHIENN